MPSRAEDLNSTQPIEFNLIEEIEINRCTNVSNILEFK